MKLTPLDIRHQEFAGALSGYSRRQVRTFLAELSDQMEEMLREQHSLSERIQELERRIEEYRAGEDELRRTVVAAERISLEMRQSAQKEVELMIREAEADRERIYGELEARRALLEQQYVARQSELEQGYLSRQTELEQRFQTRSSSLEHESMVRRSELETSLSRLRAERAQFLAQYRALLQGFGELARHHEADLALEGPLGLLDVAAPPVLAPVGDPASTPDVEPEDQDDPFVPTFSHQL